MSKNGVKKNKQLTVTLHIGGKQVGNLSDKQLERMSERLSEAMSLYYTAHHEEYLKIKEDYTCTVTI